MSTSAERMRRLRAGEPHQPAGRPVTEPCPSIAAIRRHERAHEPLCEPCRLLRNAERRQRRAQRMGNP